MGLLSPPGQPQRFGLLSPDMQEAMRRVAAMPVPQPQAPPQRSRVSGWRLLDGILGGKTVTESLDAERAHETQEAMRPETDARMARIRSYVDTLPPALQLAFASNPEKLGEAMATRAQGRVLDQGDVYLSGETPGYAAPFEAAPGSAIFDPLHPNAPVAMAPQENKVAGGALVAPDGRVLYRGPAVEGVAATADAFVTPEIAQGQGGGAPQIQRSARPDAVTVAPGGEVISFGSDGSVAGRVASSQPRPMSDSDQAAVRTSEGTLATIRTATGRAQNILRQIDNGELNLGPMTNGISGARNALGRSNQNSLNYDALMNWAREARDAILAANTGVQTDGDAVRALERIISSPQDEQVVKQAVNRFIQANAATQQVLERDIARRSGPQGGAPAASGPIAQDARGNRVQWNGSAWVPM